MFNNHVFQIRADSNVIFFFASKGIEVVSFFFFKFIFSKQLHNKMMSSLARAHGALMCISFIFMTEASETVAWWASNKSNTWINYFEKLENGPMLKNTFKRLDAGAVILSMIAFIIVLTTTSFSKAASNSERHLIYGIAALLYCYTHVMVRLYLPEVSGLRPECQVLRIFKPSSLDFSYY